MALTGQILDINISIASWLFCFAASTFLYQYEIATDSPDKMLKIKFSGYNFFHHAEIFGTFGYQ